MNALANAEVIRAGNIERNGMCKTTSLIDDPQTPGSDCNSNPASDPQDLISSEFIQDNMDYQWFIDYRDGGLHVHPSILSSLSASYTKDDLGYYDDLARNLDANLAEVDMESFRTSDIRSLLTALPVMCTDPVQHSEGEDSACSTTDTISICKSSLLFSPVKETPVLPSGGSYSVDSLDCEDMLITCQTNNKNNYTIAFEGSMTMYSDSSQDFGNTEKQKGNNVQESLNTKNLNLKNMLDLSMARSDSKIYTTWSNLKHVSIDNKKITRHPSGNNNTIPNFMHSTENPNFNTNKNKSQSLPDLIKSQEVERMEIPLNFSVDSGESSSRSGRLHSSGFSMSRSINEENSDSVGNTLSGKKLQNMSLVKLFMKQKSMSTEGMSLTLDQADSESETGWPTSNSDSGTHTNTQIHHPNFINSTQSNDLAIKWVKTDNNIKNVPKLSIHSTSLEDISNASKSVSTETQSKLHKPEIKTTGIQVKTEVEDNSVQTSLIYSLSNDKETKSEKPVYVIYPNYVLPDLSFLNSMDNKFDNIALKPQVFDKRYSRSSRPFSCNDVDSLKQRGFSHVKDWESLTFLLPVEYKKILQTVPEASEHIQLGEEARKPLFCLTPPMQHKKRTINDVLPTNISSSSSSNSTHPSSGYRGSSTILSDSSSNQQNSSNNILQGNPLYLYRYDSMSSETSLMGQDKINSSRQTQKTNGSNLLKRSNVMQNDCGAPPRPPLPRSILRKNRVSSNKRCSMFEMGQVKEINNKHLQENKRMSLQEPYYMNNDLHLMRNGGIIDSEKDIDEVEEKLQRSKTGRLKSMENEDLDSSGEDIRQLEEFLRRSGFSSHSSDSEGSELENNMKLQSCVKRFLALKMNHDITRMMDLADSQKKTVSFAVSGKLNYQKDKLTTPNTNEQIDNNFELKYLDLEEKKKIVQSVNKATNIIMKFWHGERPTYNQKPNNEMNECSQLCLSNLCPALYAVMSDGLKPNLNSAFGPISNSVWHVVEASSQQGPLTKTLNDLVQKINADDFMTEGMLKFNAFIFGLLNLKALDAWFAYLCTRESILRKHYYTNSIFVEALSCESTREVVNAFLKILHPLVFCPFQLDLLYQYRQLHNSFGQGSTLNLETNGKKPRPRSCILFDSSNNDKIIEESETNKRWSHIPLNGNFHIFDRLNDSEDYTDSLEHSPMISKASPKRSVTGKHQKSKKEDEILNTDFRKLKEKWEHFGRDDTVTNEQIPLTLPLSPTRTQVNTSKSKIPRPLTSPIRVPLNISTPQGKPAKSPSSIPSLKNKIIKKSNTFCKDSPRRTSRLDQENSTVPRNHLTRPSSLPYKTFSANTKDRNITSPHRRAASTSIPRPSSAGAPRNIPTKNAPKVVKTLTSKPESENGHLSFGEGEKLKVILEVDSKWLLCSKGERKGLVPRNCIRIVQT